MHVTSLDTWRAPSLAFLSIREAVFLFVAVVTSISTFTRWSPATIALKVVVGHLSLFGNSGQRAPPLSYLKADRTSTSGAPFVYSLSSRRYASCHRYQSGWETKGSVNSSHFQPRSAALYHSWFASIFGAKHYSLETSFYPRLEKPEDLPQQSNMHSNRANSSCVWCDTCDYAGCSDWLARDYIEEYPRRGTRGFKNWTCYLFQ